MKLHGADLWKSDLHSSIVTLTPLVAGDVSYRYSLDLSDAATYPLLRRISAIKEYNTALTGQEITFKELDADRVLDSYAIEDVNYWYRAGSAVQLRCNKSLTQLDVLYYKYPDINATVWDSWIARDFPDAVVEEALAQIYKVIGKDSESSRLAACFEENLQILRITQI